MKYFAKYLTGIILTISFAVYGNEDISQCEGSCNQLPLPDVYDSYSGDDTGNHYSATLHDHSQATIYQAMFDGDLETFNIAMQAGSQIITGDLYGKPFHDSIRLNNIRISWQLKGESSRRVINIASYAAYMLTRNYDQPDAWVIFEQMFRAADDDGKRHYNAFHYIPSLLVVRTELALLPEAQTYVSRIDGYLTELVNNDGMFLPIVIELRGYNAQEILDGWFIPYGVNETGLQHIGLTVKVLEEKLKQVKEGK